MSDFIKLQTNDYILLQTGDKLLLVIQTQNLAFSLPLITIEFVGGGVLEFSLPTLTVQFNGNLETPGSLAFSLPLLTMQANGTVTNPTLGSGICKLVPNRTKDTYYSSLVPLVTADTDIP